MLPCILVNKLSQIFVLNTRLQLPDESALTLIEMAHITYCLLYSSLIDVDPSRHTPALKTGPG